jgi:GNAT superfamily N-acetyltransferase
MIALILLMSSLGCSIPERPDLRARVFDVEIQSAVPEFMRHDPAGNLYFGDGILKRYVEFALVAVDPAERDQPVARAFCVPFCLRDGRPQRVELPDGGWDTVIVWGLRDQLDGRRPNAVSALEIMVTPRLQGRGISRVMLTAMRENVRRLGFRELWAPLRPTEKDREPETPFAEYIPRAAVPTVCHSTPGCALMFAPAPRSSNPRRAA